LLFEQKQARTIVERLGEPKKMGQQTGRRRNASRSRLLWWWEFELLQTANNSLIPLRAQSKHRSMV
jgi:hypothetical protein